MVIENRVYAVLIWNLKMFQFNHNHQHAVNQMFYLTMHTEIPHQNSKDQKCYKANKNA